jgi:hypothetical protein
MLFSFVLIEGKCNSITDYQSKDTIKTQIFKSTIKRNQNDTILFNAFFKEYYNKLKFWF